jgi:hypothetical protein
MQRAGWMDGGDRWTIEPLRNSDDTINVPNGGLDKLFGDENIQRGQNMYHCRCRKMVNLRHA